MTSIDTLKKYLRYDPETGRFYWVAKYCKKVVVGEEAGSINIGGKRSRTTYIRISVLGKSYRANILAWAFYYGEWPKGVVDHIDEDGTNNRINNLRDATLAQNCANVSKRKHNSSGYKGVSKRRGKYRATIVKSYKQYHLGDFLTVEEAAQAYCVAALEHHGEYANVT